MTTVESYGTGDGGNGVVQNSNNLGPMRAAFSPDGASVYKPVMPPTPPHLVSATPITSYPGAGGGDGSGVAAVSPAINTNTGEQTKRRRGRPRKYALDGSMAMALQPQPESDFPASGMLPPGTTVATPSGKKRGRPPGSGRKHKVASLGSPGVGFTPHVITVKAGEDVASKIMSFSQNGSRAICILSANGAISNVTLHQAASSGGTVTYEGRFEILSLSGSYMLLESNGQRSRTGGLSVLLAGPDGRVLGGGVAGLLIAAAPVQVVIGGFIVGQDSKSLNQVDSSAAPPRLIPGSPTSRGTLSESSGSPLNQSNNSHPQSMGTMSWK